MKDFLGRVIDVGDRVVCVYGNYVEFHKHTVLGFTAQKVRVGPGKLIFPNQCVVVEAK